MCQKVLNDNSESCLESPLTFSWSYSSDAAKKEISNYKQQVLEVEKLIAEEIHLNFPSRVICCESDNNDKEREYNQKVKPFKKIRDLIK